MKATGTYYQAKAKAHQRRADEYRHMAFGGNPAKGFAVNKDDHNITFNMSAMNSLTTNGDYRLVHAYEEPEPNTRLKFARETFSLFERQPDIHMSYRSHSQEGSVQRALADLFAKDKMSLKILLADLADL